MTSQASRTVGSLLVTLALSGYALAIIVLSLLMSWLIGPEMFMGDHADRDDYLGEAIGLSIAAALLVLVAVTQWLWQPITTLMTIAGVGALGLGILAVQSWQQVASTAPAHDTVWSSDGWSLLTSPWLWPLLLLTLLGIAKRLRGRTPQPLGA